MLKVGCVRVLWEHQAAGKVCPAGDTGSALRAEWQLVRQAGKGDAF